MVVAVCLICRNSFVDEINELIYRGIGVNWATLHGRCVVLRAYKEMGEGL